MGGGGAHPGATPSVAQEDEGQLRAAVAQQDETWRHLQEEHAQLAKRLAAAEHERDDRTLFAPVVVCGPRLTPVGAVGRGRARPQAPRDHRPQPRSADCCLRLRGGYAQSPTPVFGVWATGDGGTVETFTRDMEEVQRTVAEAQTENTKLIGESQRLLHDLQTLDAEKHALKQQMHEAQQRADTQMAELGERLQSKARSHSHDSGHRVVWGLSLCVWVAFRMLGG